MSATGLFLTSSLVSCVAAVLSLLVSKNEQASKLIGCFGGVVSALLGIGAGGAAIVGAAEYSVVATPFYFADFSLLLNPLAGLLLLVISLLALAAWVFGIDYFNDYRGHGLGSMGFFMNLFIASMGFVICVDNAFWFLVFFELMSLTSYFLVIAEQNESSIKGGFMYLIMAHIGFFAIMIAFFVMSGITGSFEFESFRQTAFTPVIASLSFVLCFIGFGCKAGMIPFHSWLPQAHPAAPSNVSALMSGGMIKIGVFGMLKVGLDLLQSCPTPIWWGIVVLVCGAVSSVLGVVYALAEHDIKRLLAYHSVENIGIILMGVGIGFIGVAIDNPFVSVLGFLAGLYHLLNHAMFKGLLFLGAGSVLYSAKTRNMEKLGGLARVMPVTAMCFLIGSLAISAIPPLNGFVSEWFTYQSLFTAAFTSGDALLRAICGLSAVALAITGALAVTCFVKAYGVTFLSAPRSEQARDAREVPFSMKFAMALIALVCIVLGLGAPWVAPYMQHIAEVSIQTAGPSYVAGLSTINGATEGIVSTPLIAVLLVGLVGLAIGLRALFGKGEIDTRQDPWACGYAPNSHMPVIATTFASQVDMFLAPLYDVRRALADKADAFVCMYKKTVHGAGVAENWSDRYLVDTVAHGVKRVSQWIKAVEGGDFRTYIVYIVVALIVLLAIAVVVK